MWLVLWIAGGVLIMAVLHCCSFRDDVVWFVCFFFLLFYFEDGVADDYDMWWLVLKIRQGLFR